MSGSRINLKGFIFVEAKDTPSHEVEVGKVSAGDCELFVEMIRPMSAKDWGDFLPARVYDSSKDLWNFKQENFRGIGKLINCDEIVIVLVNKRQQIEKVIPVSDLPKVQQVKVRDRIELVGGRGIQEMFDLKVAVSKRLKMEIVYNDEEWKLLKLIRQMKDADEEAKWAARKEARQERLRKIFARPDVYGYSEDGNLCHGTPVTEKEWPSLPNRSRAILVESYDDDSRTAGKIIEAFFVKKEKGGRPEKYLPKSITAEKPQKRQEEEIVEAKGVIHAVIDKRLQRVMVFSQDGIASLRKKGLNSGTHLALDQRDEQGRYTVVKLEGDECRTVGLFESL